MKDIYKKIKASNDRWEEEDAINEIIQDFIKSNIHISELELIESINNIALYHIVDDSLDVWFSDY